MPIKLQDYDIKRDGTSDDWAEINRLLSDSSRERDPVTIPPGTYRVECPATGIGVRIPDPAKIDCSLGVVLVLKPKEIPIEQLGEPHDEIDAAGITGLTVRTYPLTTEQQKARWSSIGRNEDGTLKA